MKNMVTFDQMFETKIFSFIWLKDGVDLPPIISFDIGSEDIALPPSTGSWFISQDAKPVVLVFLEQYLSVYDLDDRQPLLNAYHDSAIFSLTCSYPHGQSVNASSRYLIRI